MIEVKKKQCESCIYRADSPLDITRLEAQVADPHMEGFFKGWRECHSAERGSGVCCRGFWNRHKNNFTMGQVAQRLNGVTFID